MVSQTLVNRADPNDPNYKKLAEKAWQIWEKANQLADKLWDEFEPYFLDKCIEQHDDDDFPDMPATEWPA